jgi:hypothetical protein
MNRLFSSSCTFLKKPKVLLHSLGEDWGFSRRLPSDLKDGDAVFQADVALLEGAAEYGRVPGVFNR